MTIFLFRGITEIYQLYFSPNGTEIPEPAGQRAMNSKAYGAVTAHSTDKSGSFAAKPSEKTQLSNSVCS